MHTLITIPAIDWLKKNSQSLATEKWMSLSLNEVIFNHKIHINKHCPLQNIDNFQPIITNYL